MLSHISIDQEKSRFRAFLNLCWVLAIIYMIFIALSLLCFGALDVICRFKLMAHENALHINWARLAQNPMYLFELYREWWQTLLRSMRLMAVRPVLFVPFVVPAGMIVAIIIVFVKRSYSFSLWYVLNYHFAKLKDIENMGLNKGMFMVLGRFANTILSIKPSESVLCLGEMGTGKTSSVAIPSVLRSDNACVIAVDTTGLLPKYTAGHRAELGEIVYYNWDLPDNPEQNVFYPRWNPLAKENMPQGAKEQEAYLRRMAGYLISIDDKDEDNYWSLLAHTMVVAFLAYWTVKTMQAQANDYFLGKLLEDKHLTKDEKDILLSYYIQMPKSYTKDAIEALENDCLNKDNYLPIGSWAGIPEQWTGRDVCFAAINDWIISNYLASQDDNCRDWRGWTESLLREAALFGYGGLTMNGLRQFLSLSAKQRRLVLACVVRGFRPFTNQAIRERTSGNDFNLDAIRGIFDEQNNCWRPITVYSLANTYSSKILSRMFLDEVLYRGLHLKENQGPLPVMLVLDDVGHNLRLKHLTELLTVGKLKKMSALLLCNSLTLVENTYSREELESLVVNTAYKIIKAPDNQKLSRQLGKLATFATRSVQIPKEKTKRWIGGGRYFANANYFHRLAKDFNLRKSVKIDTGKHQIVLVEGYYHRPILADNIFFAKDERFKQLAVLDAEYALSADKLAAKNKADLATPKIADLFNRADLGIDDLVELDQYMDVVFEEAQMETDAKSKNGGATTSIVSKKTVANTTAKAEEKDWWLEENAFSATEKENPFERKK